MTDEQVAIWALKFIRAVADATPSLTAWISAVSATLTLAVALVALRYAKAQIDEAASARKQTKDLELEKSQPYVVAYLEPSAVGWEVLELVVKNFGQTAGRAIAVEFTPPLTRAVGDNGEEEVTLPETISFLAPGQEWRTVFEFTSARVTRTDMPDVYHGNVRYFGVDRRLLSSDVTLDLRPYKATLYMDVLGIHHGAKALREIRDNQKAWSEFPRGIKVFARDGAAKDSRLAEQIEVLAEMRKSTAEEP